MGTVYKACHRETQEVVAVKVMPAEVARNPVLLKRFEQEFRIAANLNHPNVVRVLEYCGDGPTPFLVMELVEGESLGEKLAREGRLSEDEAVRIIVQVAHGLHRAHRQGLIHRDVKPDNILVSPDGRAKLIDLGLAKDMDGAAGLTRTGRGLGTPAFMAPEQFRDAKNASIRCDVYSLAATLYQLVTGRLPFGVDDPVRTMQRKLRNELTPPRQLAPDLSERTDAAIRRATSADPEQRPATCREFVEDLLRQGTTAGPEFGGPDPGPAPRPGSTAEGQPEPPSSRGPSPAKTQPPRPGTDPTDLPHWAERPPARAMRPEVPYPLGSPDDPPGSPAMSPSRGRVAPGSYPAAGPPSLGGAFQRWGAIILFVFIVLALLTAGFALLP
jgi:serine/threonine protein kinase